MNTDAGRVAGYEMQIGAALRQRVLEELIDLVHLQ
jgi:hypothetical protein